jgi:hypothetical protein
MTTSAISGIIDTNLTVQALDINSKLLRRSNMVAPATVVVSSSMPRTVDGTYDNLSVNGVT